MVVEQASPRAAKSADRMDGATMAGGDIVAPRNCVSDGTRAAVVLILITISNKILCNCGPSVSQYLNVHTKRY